MLDGEETVEIALGESFAGRERDSMLDGQEAVQIACAELRWEGARQHSSRGNGLGRAQCRAVGAAFSELLARFFQDKCHHCDCPEILWTEDWSNGQDRSNGFQRQNVCCCSGFRFA